MKFEFALGINKFYINNFWSGISEAMNIVLQLNTYICIKCARLEMCFEQAKD